MVSTGEVEIEIECKRKSIDAGGIIKKRDFYFLADILFAELKESKRRLAVLISSDRPMGRDVRLYRALAKSVKELLQSNGDTTKLSNFAIKVVPLAQDHRIQSELDFAHALAAFHSPFAYAAVASGPESTTIVRCESAEPNKVLDAIYDDLKKGASQLSGQRPSLLSCLIEEIEDKDLAELQQGSVLQAVAAKLFANPSRQHVNMLVFSSDRTLLNARGMFYDLQPQISSLSIRIRSFRCLSHFVDESVCPRVNCLKH